MQIVGSHTIQVCSVEKAKLALKSRAIVEFYWIIHNEYEISVLICKEDIFAHLIYRPQVGHL